MLCTPQLGPWDGTGQGRVAARRGDGMGWDGMACGYCAMAVHSVLTDDPSAAGDGAGGQVRARAPRRQPRAIRLPQGAVGVHLDVRALPIQGALRRNPNASQRRQRQAKAEEKPSTTKQKRRRGARQHAKFMGTHRLWLCIRWVVNRSFEQQAKAESPRGAGRGGAGRGGAGRGGWKIGATCACAKRALALNDGLNKAASKHASLENLHGASGRAEEDLDFQQR